MALVTPCYLKAEVSPVYLIKMLGKYKISKLQGEKGYLSGC